MKNAELFPVWEETEEMKPELACRGFEFFKNRDVGANSRAANPHIHDAIEIIYVSEGSLSVSVDDLEEQLEVGDLAIFRSRGVHRIRTRECPVNNYYVLKIRPKLIHDISPTSLAGKLAFRFSVYRSDMQFVWRKSELEGTEIRKGLNGLISELGQESALTDMSMLISTITVLYGILKSGKELERLAPATDSIYESILYVNSHFDEDITAEAISAQMGMSYSYFSRSFKRATGKSFKEYLNITRTGQAEQLLVNTDMSVTDVALACGYNNISYFISLYRKYKGKTPLAERRASRH